MDKQPKNARNGRLFARLAGHTEYLKPSGAGFRLREYIETPYDEFGIIDKRELFRRLLGSVSVDFYWDGSYEGPHHLLWPRSHYTTGGAHPERPLSERFRGAPSLRVILRRDLHDWLHEATQPPQVPSREVMWHHDHEQGQILRLYDTIRHRSLSKIHGMSHEQKEAYRLRRFHELLGEMDDGHVGLMPQREALARMPLMEARAVIRSLARVQGLSNDSSCQRAFFADPYRALHK